jgi:hypothetical protein
MIINVSMRLAQPIADRIPIDAVAGIALANIVSAAIILVACLLAGIAAESVLKPVLARFDDVAQVAFEVERGPGDLVTVYLPGSPDPWSGSVAHVTADRITPLDRDFASVISSLRKVGREMPALLESHPAKVSGPSE